MAKRKRLVILGGGLAGLSGAVAIPEEDFEVVLVERRPFLGGRASSYPIPKIENLEEGRTTALQAEKNCSLQDFGSGPDEGDEQSLVDNCQHVLMKCCTNLLDFYRRLSVDKAISFSDHYTFLDENGRRARLKCSLFPAPFHLLPSFLQFHPLGWRDKLSMAYALVCMLSEEHLLERLDGMTMLEWLSRHGQTPRAIERFWQTILVSALNEDVTKASARYGLKVFLDGLLKHRQAFRMGVPIVPLEKLYTEPCLKLITRKGGKVRMRCSAVQIEIRGSRVESVLLNDGSRLTGDYYLSSLPPQALLGLLPAGTEEELEYFKKMRGLEYSPITAVYLWFDRQVMKDDNAALIGREIQWIFNKSPRTDPTAKEQGQNLGLVVSASRKLAQMGRGQILEIALRDLKAVLPEARHASLLRAVVLKEPYATFSCRPGSDSFRPDQKSPIQNLYVAGDWTRTGWPPTMEGAVRSSYRCVELILEGEGRAQKILQPDLPVQFFPRWLTALSEWFRSDAPSISGSRG
jgi:squalene-associated FAD-dependent desaturase